MTRFEIIRAARPLRMAALGFAGSAALVAGAQHLSAQGIANHNSNAPVNYLADRIEVQDKAKIALAELIAKVNDLFEGDLTPGDKLVYVNDVIKGKLMESQKLAEQAMNNTKEQFAASPDLAKEILGAVMDALSAHTVMSKQALASELLRADMRDVLLGAGKLWEGLRERALGAGVGP